MGQDSQIQTVSQETLAFQEYRAHTGTEEQYDIRAALQFNLLTTLGLRDQHYLLDIGCGSLCGGRLYIPYLRPGRYFGLEPVEWLVQKGIAEEVGQSAVDIKKPTFLHNDDFGLTAFGRKFDFLIAQSIFSHTSQRQLRKCLSEAAKVMAPHSIFAASFFEGPTNYEGERWTVHADYTLEKMRAMVEEHGLIMRAIDWDHQDLQRWIVILHKDTTVELPDLTNSGHLGSQLARAQEQLASIRSHPYMRLGYKIKFSLIAVRFFVRRIRRTVLGR